MTHYTSQALLAHCINRAFVLCVKHGSGTINESSDIDAIVEVVRQYDTDLYQYITNMPECDYLEVFGETVSALYFGNYDIDLNPYTEENKTALSVWAAEVGTVTMLNADGC